MNKTDANLCIKHIPFDRKIVERKPTRALWETVIWIYVESSRERCEPFLYTLTRIPTNRGLVRHPNKAPPMETGGTVIREFFIQ